MHRTAFLAVLLASLSVPDPAAAPSTSVGPCGSARNLDVRDFGAKGDGRTDDSRAFQAALDAASHGGGTVRIPTGIHVVANLRVDSCTEIRGDGNASVVRVRSGSTEAERGFFAFSVNPGRAGSPDPATNAHDVVFRSFQIEGTTAKDGFSEHKHLLNLNALTNALVEDITFVGFRGDGIYIGSGNEAGLERHNRAIVIRNCRFDGVNGGNRNAISVVDGDGVLITGCTFSRCSRRGMPGPIDLEPNPDAGTYAVLHDISIIGNRFDSCSGNAAVGVFTRPLRLARRLHGVRIRSNQVLASNHFGVAALWVATGEDLTVQHPSMAVEIADNQIQVDAPIAPIRLTGVSGCAVTANEIRGGGPSWIGDPAKAATTAVDFTVRQNRFEDSGSPDGALIIGSVRGLEIASNRFVRTKAGEEVAIRLVGKGATTTSRDLTISDNSFVAGPGELWRILVSAHSSDRGSLRMNRNVVEGGGRLTNDLER